MTALNPVLSLSVSRFCKFLVFRTFKLMFSAIVPGRRESPNSLQQGYAGEFIDSEWKAG
jgi:hypothetical protein